jgi:hypothetical protein
MKRKYLDNPEDFQKRSKLDMLFQVFCRVRPLASGESAGSYEWSATGLTISSSETYSFTQVFPPDALQDQIFEVIGAPAVSNLLLFRNSLIFAYGITSSGKTHTIQGTKESPGLIPRVLRRLLDHPVSGLLASYYEIYNDRIFDLLNSRAMVRLLQDDSATRIPDLTMAPFQDLAQVEMLLTAGMKARKVSETALNEVSSRSHSVFVIWLKTELRTAQLAIVDLAGAERATRTETAGDRLKEARAINSSLSVLGRCLSALKSNHRSEAPYRESKLTQVLRDFFVSGDSQITLILNLNPRIADVDETRSALKFAAMAAEIVIKSTRETASLKTECKPNSAELEALRRELLEANRKIEQLEESVKQQSEENASNRKELITELDRLFGEMEQGYRNNLRTVEDTYEAILKEKNSELEKLKPPARAASSPVRPALPLQSNSPTVPRSHQRAASKHKRKKPRSPSSPIARRTRTTLADLIH